MEPVQSEFTVYVPLTLTLLMLPFELTVAIAFVLPFPSKVCRPISPNGPANGGGT
jgi:hypothetical protein